MYPALINNTTIDWFMGWPADALTEVATKFLGETDLEAEYKDGLSYICSYAHTTTTDNADQMKKELSRIFYVTPTNYIELLKGYKSILTDKRT
jgi:dynein heavy chain